jgi:hypothetical protein
MNSVADTSVRTCSGEGHAGVVAVEQRWNHLPRQHGGDEQLAAAERLHHHVAELARLGRGLRQLQIFVLPTTQ